MRANARSNHLRIGRVLHEDDDFITVEVGKRDDVTFHLQQDDEGVTVGGDQFLSMLFVHADRGEMKSWHPWEHR